MAPPKNTQEGSTILDILKFGRLRLLAHLAVKLVGGEKLLSLF